LYFIPDFDASQAGFFSSAGRPCSTWVEALEKRPFSLASARHLRNSCRPCGFRDDVRSAEICCTSSVSGVVRSPIMFICQKTSCAIASRSNASGFSPRSCRFCPLTKLVSDYSGLVQRWAARFSRPRHARTRLQPSRLNEKEEKKIRSPSMR